MDFGNGGGADDFLADLMQAGAMAQQQQLIQQQQMNDMMQANMAQQTDFMTQQSNMMAQQTGMMNQQNMMMAHQTYGGYDPYGQMMNGMKPIRYSRGQMLQGLRDFVVNISQTAISREERIEDTPQVLRHACAPSGVSGLGVNHFPIPEMNVNIPFYFCKSCGKLYYYKDFSL